MESKALALFPLNLFLLPGDQAQLFIFEDRYKHLIREVIESGESFGIPFTHKENTFNHGSLVEVVEVLKTYDTGEMDILIKCTSNFVLDRFFIQQDHAPYPGGLIHFEEHLNNTLAGPVLVQEFKQYLIEKEDFDNELLTKTEIHLFDIANHLHLNNVERIDLINIADQKSANAYLSNYIQYIKLLNQQEGHTFHNFYLN